MASHVSGMILYAVDLPILKDHFFPHTLSACAKYLHKNNNYTYSFMFTAVQFSLSDKNQYKPQSECKSKFRRKRTSVASLQQEWRHFAQKPIKLFGCHSNVLLEFFMIRRFQLLKKTLKLSQLIESIVEWTPPPPPGTQF